MKVVDFEENEDGSANIKVETTLEETKFLVEYAILDILEKTVNIKKEENTDE